MDTNLPKELRCSAASLLDFIRRQSPEITGTPRRIQVVYEAADDLEKLKRELDAAVEELKGVCHACVHNNSAPHCDGDCSDCKLPCLCSICDDGGQWEWRGLQKEDQ